jgi:hypothetical protein
VLNIDINVPAFLSREDIKLSKLKVGLAAVKNSGQESIFSCVRGGVGFTIAMKGKGNGECFEYRGK